MIHQLSEAEVEGKTVLLQANLDVPLDEGEIEDDSRLKASLETIQFLLEKECKVLVCGHLGRPGGKVVPELSTKIVAEKLSELLSMDVEHADQVVGGKVAKKVDHLPKPGVLVLENLRFESGQEEPSMEFAEDLARLADVFVNDDYIDIHRREAVNVYLPKLLPSFIGFTLKKEIDIVKQAVDDPDKPFVLIIGGAKKDKIGVINHLIGVADHIIVGGVLANTFLKASGVDVKGSKFDELSLEIAGEFLRDEEEKFILPVDAIVADSFDEEADFKEVPLSDIPEKWMVLDIGSQTIEKYQDVLSQAKTIIWGGPVGVFEWKNFRRGTEQLANFIAEADAFSLVAGGDSGDAIKSLGLSDKVSHVSIGGGATLNLIAGEELPGIRALDR